MENTNILEQIGLTEKQSKVYNYLLVSGISPARKIILSTSLKRGITYEILEQLIKLELVEKVDNIGKVTLFRPNHPSHLEKIFENKKNEIKTAETNFQNEYGKFVSAFNLLSGKPNVQFYEGVEGIKKVVADLPIEDKEMCSYIDSQKILEILPEENAIHLKRRIKLGIKKRIIIPNTEFAIERARNYNKEFTDVRVMKGSNGFETAVEIYDNKVSFLTLEKDKIIGLIVEDKNISKMQKQIFDTMWANGEEIK